MRASTCYDVQSSPILLSLSALTFACALHTTYYGMQEVVPLKSLPADPLAARVYQQSLPADSLLAGVYQYNNGSHAEPASGMQPVDRDAGQARTPM